MRYHQKKILMIFAGTCFLLAGLLACMNCGNRMDIDTPKVQVHYLQLNKVKNRERKSRSKENAPLWMPGPKKLSPSCYPLKILV